MTISGLGKKQAWQKARILATEINRDVIPLLPKEEKYNLNSQIRRSAASIPANIAEGYGRFYYQSNDQFCYNARGSLEELISHLILVHELGYIEDRIFGNVITKANLKA